MINRLKECLIPLDRVSKKQIELKCAAVLLPLIFDIESDEWQILLTKRAKHLKHHPGQISFPGGGYETHDLDLSVTATRETHEEVGIEPELIQLLGKLPQQETISQYYMTPFVGIIESNYQLKIDPNEVAEVFTVPFDFLINEANQIQVTEAINGTEYTYHKIQYKQYNIWGATARILVNLSRRLNALN